MIAARELNLAGIGDSQRNWANDHIVYTHGFGVVAAYDNTSNAGKPAFFEENLPPTGLLDVEQPRIYFGENSPAYSIVGGPADGPKRELDFPTDDGQENYTYTGSGGIPTGVAAQPAAVRGEVPGAEHRALGPHQPGVAHPRGPRPARPRREGRAVARRSTATRTPPWSTAGCIWMVDAYTTSDALPERDAHQLR